MGFWGWRPLLCSLVISVWVVGCNIVSDASPNAAPTDTPPVTLTVRRLATATPTGVSPVTATPTMPAPTTDVETTATPVVYEIQDGDTLGDIALRFGIDLTALRDANPDVDPRLMQPGQRIILPVATEAVPSAPSPTPTPPQLALNPPTCYETPGGDLLCLGQVENTLDYALEHVEVLVQAMRPDTQEMDSARATVEQAIIPPEEAAPYRVLFDSDGDATQATTILQRADSAPDVESRFITLDVEDEALEVVDGRSVLTASLTNPGPDAARAIRAVVTLIDSRGRVIGYRVTSVADQLAAGESVPLRVEIVTQITVDEPTYTLYVEARRESSE